MELTNFFRCSTSRKCLNICFVCTNLIILIFLFFSFGIKREDTPIFISNHLSEKEKLISNTNDFQKIGTGEEKLYAYSAYYQTHLSESANYASVNVIAGLLTKSDFTYYCRLYTEDGIHYTTVKAVLKDLSEDNDYYKLPYQSYYIICHFDKNIYELPTYVSILEFSDMQTDAPVSNLLKIKYKETEDRYKFSVCVQPIFNYDNPLKFAEWVEYYRLMGVEKFTLYNMSIGVNTSCVIDSYRDLIEVFPWSVPYSRKEFRINAQALASHDCLNRHKGVSDYLISVDMDEMIVPHPRIGSNFAEMIKYLTRYYSQYEVVTYTFRNAFYFTEWITDKSLFQNSSVFEDDSPEQNIFSQMHLASKLFWLNVEMYASRSKYIAIPDKISELAVHYVVEILGTGISVDVPFEMAYLHHYRNCKGIEEVCETGERTFDNSALRFAEPVAKAIADQLLSNAEMCDTLQP